MHAPRSSLPPPRVYRGLNAQPDDFLNKALSEAGFEPASTSRLERSGMWKVVNLVAGTLRHSAHSDTHGYAEGAEGLLEKTH